MVGFELIGDRIVYSATRVGGEDRLACASFEKLLRLLKATHGCVRCLDLVSKTIVFQDGTMVKIKSTLERHNRRNRVAFSGL